MTPWLRRLSDLVTDAHRRRRLRVSRSVDTTKATAEMDEARRRFDDYWGPRMAIDETWIDPEDDHR